MDALDGHRLRGGNKGIRALNMISTHVLRGGASICTAVAAPAAPLAALRAVRGACGATCGTVRGAARHPKSVPHCGHEKRPQNETGETEHMVPSGPSLSNAVQQPAAQSARYCTLAPQQKLKIHLTFNVESSLDSLASRKASWAKQSRRRLQRVAPDIEEGSV